MTAGLLELEDVTLERAGRSVLRGVSLSVAGAAVTALLGPSGAGKSTLLRCLVRLEEPDGGRVRLAGRDVRELDPCALRRRVGLVAQHPVMLPGTVRDNLVYALVDAPTAGALGQALERTGLDAAFLERSAGRLSGGEQARVAIARALMRGPEALLLDEPTAALDPARAASIEALMRQLAADGLTVVVTTHDVALARRSAAHAALLVDGRVVCAAEPAAVVEAWEGEPAWR